MKTKLTFFLLLIISCLRIEAQTLQWAKGMGGMFNGDVGYGITVDALGNVYTTGAFRDTCDFDPGVGTFTLAALPGATDIFISKLNAAGNFVWAKKMATTIAGSNSGNSIGTDAAGNVYTTGRFSVITDFDPGAGTYTLNTTGGSNVFISKLDGAGNFVWAKSMSAVGFDIALDASGNVYTTGLFSGGVDFDPGPGTFTLATAGGDDIFVSKLDAAGNFVWAKSMGGSSLERGISIAADAAGNVYTTGRSPGGDFDPGVATYSLTSSGGDDIFVSKLDASGNFVWAKLMGGAATDLGNGITVDGSGNVYTTGYFGTVIADFDPGVGTFNMTSAGGDDIFVSKLDASGNFVWAKKMGGGNSDEGKSIAVDASGNIYTTGFFEGTADFDPGTATFNLTGSQEIFISKLDASGNFISAQKFGSLYLDEGLSIALDASCNVYSTGRFRGTVDFDPGTGVFNLISVGGAQDDIYVLKLTCSPTVVNEENGFLNDEMSIYPNPSTGIFTIKNDNISSLINFEVYNLLGEKILRKQNSKEIDLSNAVKGIYFVKIAVGTKNYTEKIIVH